MSTAAGAWQVTKTLFVRLRFIFIFVAIGLVVGNWERIVNHATRLFEIGRKAAGAGEFEWYCPMHPSVVRESDKEKCPICFMNLSRRRRGEEPKLPPGVRARLQLTPEKILMGGVAVEEIGYRNLVREIRTVGTLEWDERKIAYPSVRIAGRVDELYVNFTGQKIRKGDPLYKLYSPDLVTTQEEYLLALKALEEIRAASRDDDSAVGRARRLADSARERMRLWGITEEQLAELEKSRKAQTHLVIASPIGGVVTKKGIDIGHYVMVGEDPWTVADDSLLWMQARVFERDLGLVREGQLVEISAEAFPGKTFTGKAAFISPELEAETRTAKVRVEIPNPEAKFKAGMFVTAVFRVPVGRSGEIFWGC
jgi:RND family efflux transporter MFP subunit